MMFTPMNQLPSLALKYADYMCRQGGMCGDVLLTAWCHYACAVEGLKSSESAYQADASAVQWFKEHGE